MDINNNKAPRCDRYNVLFFKKTWHILREEVTEALMEFFHYTTMCKDINCTTITLISKVKNQGVQANLMLYSPLQANIQSINILVIYFLTILLNWYTLNK